MKLYKGRIPAIAHAVITTFCDEGRIEVEPENRPEAEKDLIAIMEEYRRRDAALRDAVKEYMGDHGVPYESYGKTRQQIADEWGHPLPKHLDRYLARQFVENFMISRFVNEVFGDDADLQKRAQTIIAQYDVDEDALRKEAEDRIKNVRRDSVEYELAIERSLKEVRKRHGLLE
jgi:hypothetical protein